jgi:aminoglycoside phosphotransferase (APT) family kinase protein
MVDRQGAASNQVAHALGLDAVELVPIVAGAANLAYEVRDFRNPSGPPVGFLRSQGAGALMGTAYDLRREAAIVRSAAAAGYPVAHVIATFDEPVSILMRVVPGTSRLTPQETEIVAAEYLGLVARLHDTDPALFPVEQHSSIIDAVQADIDWWSMLARDGGVSELPVLRVAEQVLRESMPQVDEPPVMLHSDVGPGNFMVEHGHVTAMLDWEVAHVGDPHEDMAWMWMRGAHTEFGDPLIRLAEYEAASRRQLDPARLRWHLAFVMWKSCLSMEVGLRRYPATSATLLHSVVLLTYEALLGAQVVRVLGGPHELLTQQPERATDVTVRLAERLVETPGSTREAQLIAEYLRDRAAQAQWEYRETFADQHFEEAIQIARASDRAAMASPKAIRRIERAQRIGLGTREEPTIGAWR